MKTWSHPQLGQFQHDESTWRRMVAVPALESFSYLDAAVAQYGAAREPFELVLQCDNEHDRPTEATAALAERILDREATLVPMLLEAVWEDLQGRGPVSGMWWHGDFETVLAQISALGLPVPATPEGLMAVLEPKNLTIRRDFGPPHDWIGEFNFHAAFDIEHGVGVLTDGAAILGIGYSGDAIRYGE